MTTRKSLLAASAGLLALATGIPAHAQNQPVPPERYTLDARGVDLVTGQFNYSTTEVVIGQPGAGGHLQQVYLLLSVLDKSQKFDS